jgi:hypothetical protein
LRQSGAGVLPRYSSLELGAVLLPAAVIYYSKEQVVKGWALLLISITQFQQGVPMTFADMSSFEYNLREYTSSRRRNQNHVARVRSKENGFEEKLVVLNPTFEPAKDGRLVPTLPLEHVGTVTYFNTLPNPIGLAEGCQVSVSRYERQNYENTGLGLTLEVVDSIYPFLESDIKRPGGRRLGLSAKQIAREIRCLTPSNKLYYYIVKRYRTSKASGELLASDVPWTERANMFRLVMPPHFVLDYLASVSQDWDKNEVCDMMREQKDIPHPPDLYDVVDSVSQVTWMDIALFRGFWLLAIDPLVSEYLDTSLVKFLLGREIPTLQSVIRRHLTEPIQNRDVDFLTKMHWGLLNLFLETPDAITRFAAALFTPFCESLVEDGVLSRCKYCHGYFKYRRTKKYCSLVSEGRDCGKKARNRLDYQRHRSTRLQYYRAEMRETREYYKKLRKFSSGSQVE